MTKKRTGESLKDLFKKEVSFKALKNQNVKTFKRQSAKTSRHQDVKVSKNNRRHTIYLSPEQSKKLKLYAAKNDMQLSKIIEKLINENL